MSEIPWTVDFWLDPSCPLTRLTARWITQIADQTPVHLRWWVMSLSVLNEHRADDPEGDPEGYLWIPARVAVAVQTEHGHDALGAFYDALWTHPKGSERKWIGDITEALRRCSLPADLADVGTSTRYDTELRASHRAAISRVDAEIGTPVLVITSPTGEERACFGPVLSTVPTGKDALRLWEATRLLSGIGGFRELKC